MQELRWALLAIQRTGRSNSSMLISLHTNHLGRLWVARRTAGGGRTCQAVHTMNRISLAEQRQNATISPCSAPLVRDREVSLRLSPKATIRSARSRGASRRARRLSSLRFQDPTAA